MHTVDDKNFTSNVVIYTDGSCRNNPGAGGWCGVLLAKTQNGNIVEKIVKGCEKQTTNNRMELTAVLKSLVVLKKKSNIDLYTDSKYVMDGATLWLDGWIKKNWKTTSGCVANKDLWEQLVGIFEKHNINWHWVKGHNGDFYNEKVDKIAQEQSLLV